MFPAEPAVEILINGRRIGLLQEYSVSQKTAIHAPKSFGSNSPAALLPGEVSYAITLKRLLLDRVELPMQFAPYGMKDFTLTIREQQRSLTYSGCQWTLIKESYQLGQSLLEELQLVALRCTRQVLA